MPVECPLEVGLYNIGEIKKIVLILGIQIKLHPVTWRALFGKKTGRENE